jgi:hypothetical protein
VHRLFAAALALFSALAASLLIPSTASAVPLPTVTVTGSASPTSASAGQPVTFSYTVTSSTPYTAASLTATPDVLLTFVAGSADVDGAPATGVVALPGIVTVPLPDSPGSSTHVVTFQAKASGTAPANTTSGASLSFTDGAHPLGTSISAAAVTVALNVPDLAVSYPVGSGQDGTLPLPLGGSGTLDVLVSNAGQGSPATTLFIDFPASLTLDGTTVMTLDSELGCVPVVATPGRFSCDIGPLNSGETTELGVPVTTTGAAVVGQTATMTVSAQPTDPTVLDLNQANNSKTATIQFVLAPHLVPTISSASSKVVIGKTTSLTLSVRNEGDGPADIAIALAALENQHFAITSFDGATLDPGTVGGSAGGSGSGSGGGISPLALRHAVASSKAAKASSWAARLTSAATAPADPSGLAWDLGTLAPGQSITAHLTVKAVSLGSTRVGLLPLSVPQDPACFSANAVPTACFAEFGLQAVAAPVVVAHPAAVTPTAVPVAAGPTLANTGTRTTTPTLLAAALLLLGAGALRLGRRRG